MKVFVSWSGAFSKKYAEAFREWIARIFPEVDIFISSQDIHLGERGIDAIEENLSTYDFGVIFVSRENISAPWLYYEAGALSRSIQDARRRVAPVLIDCTISEIANTPLSFYQGCVFDRDGIMTLCASMNSALARSRTDAVLKETFDMWWPKLEEVTSQIEKPKEDKRRITNDTILNEVEDVKKILVRMQNKLDTGNTRTNYLKTLAEDISEREHIKSSPSNKFRRLTVTLDQETAEKLESLRNSLEMSYNSTLSELIRRSLDEKD